MSVDQLTGLPTYDDLRDTLTDGPPVYCVAFDIDALVMVTDFFGHTRSDDVIASVATALRSSASRQGTTAYRVGGDEFLVVLPGRDRAAAEAFARRCIADVASLELEFRHHGNPKRTHVEINAVLCRLYTSTGATNSELRERIADAIYAAKDGDLQNVPVVADCSGECGPWAV